MPRAPKSVPDPSLANKQSRELDRRTKELETWVTTLDEREQALDEKRTELDHQIKLLEARVLARHDELATLEGRQETIKAEGQKIVDGHLARQRKASEEAQKATSFLTERKALLVDCTEAIKLAKKQLKATEDEIKERKVYFVDQEGIITQALNIGNQAIQATNRELGEMEKQKEAILVEVHTFHGRIKQVTDELEAAETKLATLDARYTEAVERYRLELGDLRKEIETTQADRDNREQALTARHDELATRARELTVQAEVLDRRAGDLADEQRRLDSKRALYGTQ